MGNELLYKKFINVSAMVCLGDAGSWDSDVAGKLGVFNYPASEFAQPLLDKIGEVVHHAPPLFLVQMIGNFLNHNNTFRIDG